MRLQYRIETKSAKCSFLIMATLILWLFINKKANKRKETILCSTYRPKETVYNMITYDNEK